ncbi:hypothetical protein KSP40_PGU018668 [Platanthera guangdongensis]|uniref:Uncharacterized protein n=1 Tax=Platanthera guangdongensis TaxID=2320717 RepID=A0ABR2LRT7_9ASPA
MSDAKFDGADMSEVVMSKAYAVGASFKGQPGAQSIPAQQGPGEGSHHKGEVRRLAWLILCGAVETHRYSDLKQCLARLLSQPAFTKNRGALQEETRQMSSPSVCLPAVWGCLPKARNQMRPMISFGITVTIVNALVMNS